VSASSHAPDRDDARFLTTRWSVVLAAVEEHTPAGRAALESLCKHYWFPLYAFARRRGESHEGAQDAVQSLFAALLERRDLSSLSPERGRFRAFLLAAMKHLLANEARRASAEKRGGARVTLSIDFDDAATRYAAEPVDALTPETLFDRAWALEVLRRTLDLLALEYEAEGRRGLFDQLERELAGERVGYAAVGTALGMTEGAVKVAAHRLRRRWRELLRSEIAGTVASEIDVEAELAGLFEALGRGG
jgi:RNA polymerase sigma factor (sigma-70 family)